MRQINEGDVCLFCEYSCDEQEKMNEDWFDSANEESCCLVTFGDQKRGENYCTLLISLPFTVSRTHAKLHLPTLFLFQHQCPRGGACVGCCAHWGREEFRWTEGGIGERDESSRVSPSQTHLSSSSFSCRSGPLLSPLLEWVSED